MEAEAQVEARAPARTTHALLISVFVIATCGLVYELIAGTLASYLLGDSVTQFSTIIGAYLFSMGIGSWASRWVDRDLTARFIQIEILVGLVGGLGPALLFVAFAHVEAFRVVLYLVVGVIGVLVGMEIPLLLRILKDRLQFHDLVSKVLSLDYLGALLASVLFPLWLVPRLGLVRAGVAFGILNVLVGLAACRLFRGLLRDVRSLVAQGLVALAALGGTFALADRLTAESEAPLGGTVIHARQTAYQRLALVRLGPDLRLYLNGHLQFSTYDEYRYHEALVHPALASVARPSRVLVLGGGDGLAVRELLRDERVQRLTLVDLDPEMTALFRDHPVLSGLNGRSLSDQRVEIVNADAFVWLKASRETWDLVVVDFPDPTTYSLGKLYTTAFYRTLKAHLAEGGVAVIQSTSPLSARRAFWCIVETTRAAGLVATPYHAFVPSFGEWGFVVASREPFTVPTRYPAGLRFLDPAGVPGWFHFPPDMGPEPVEINRLDNQSLVRYYESDWARADL